MESSHSNNELTSVQPSHLIDGDYLSDKEPIVVVNSVVDPKNHAKMSKVTHDHFLDCYGAVHIPVQGEPFEKLAMKMTTVKKSNGKIKKRILREGYGSILSNACLVSIYFRTYSNNAYEPCNIGSHFTFYIDDTIVSHTLKTAVKTMKTNEISQFLIQTEFILPTKNPPNAVILYEIQIRRVVDCIVCISKRQLANFNKMYQYAVALCSKGNNYYHVGSIKNAIIAYSTAESKLDNYSMWQCDATLKNVSDQHNLLFRLRSNLVVAYTKIQEPYLTCLIYNKIHDMCRRLELKMNAKILYNHALSLSQLSHYRCAETQLQRAQKLEPYNLIIAKELTRLNVRQQENFNRELELAKTIFQNMEIFMDLENKEKITNEFKKCLTEYCKTLSKDEDCILYNLPNKLTEGELNFIKEAAVKYGLELNSIQTYGANLYTIVKRSKKTHN